MLRQETWQEWIALKGKVHQFKDNQLTPPEREFCESVFDKLSVGSVIPVVPLPRTEEFIQQLTTQKLANFQERIYQEGNEVDQKADELIAFSPKNEDLIIAAQVGYGNISRVILRLLAEINQRGNEKADLLKAMLKQQSRLKEISGRVRGLFNLTNPQAPVYPNLSEIKTLVDDLLVND